MKRSTKAKPKGLDPRLTARIMRTYGLAASISRLGGFSKSYVSKVLHGVKSPSARFFGAAFNALEQMTGNMTLHILKEQFRHEAERRYVREKHSGTAGEK